MFRFWRGPRGPGRGHVFHRPGGGPGPGGRLGVRRPLRFLIERLGLDEAQANELSRALDDLRLEREQAALDVRRAVSRVADLLDGDVLDVAAVAAAAELRVAAARREADAFAAALTRVHAALGPAQRPKLAMLLRAGPLAL
jgi:Spy/CpxP family protein refolding chaperone